MDDLEQRLRDARPEAPADVLDNVKHRLAPTRRASSARTGSFVVSLLLALGIVSTGTGGALAVSGLSQKATAAQAEYPQPVVAPSSSASTESSGTTLGGGSGNAGGGQSGVAGEQTSSDD